MIANYVKTSLRRFRRTKTHTLINVAGLTLGLVCAIILFQKVRYEYSFDTHHPAADRLYRVVTESRAFGDESYSRGLPYPFFEAFRTDFPEIEHVTIVDRNFADPVIAVAEPDGTVRRFLEEGNAAFVDPAFFEIFGYTWLHGDPATALTAPRTVVLAESLARKYAGDPAAAMGRVLTFDNVFDLTIVGVVADPPPNTALPLHLLISFDLGEAHDRANDEWGSVASGVQAFLELPPGLTPERVETRLAAFVERHRGAEEAATLRLGLQPVREIHFDARYGSDQGHTIVTRELLRALSLIGFFLLVTACINFINLNTVLVFRRAKEIGVRKVLGGTPGQIRLYFLTETALITAAALGLALLLATPVMALVRSFIGEGFTANPFTDPVLAGAVGLAGLGLVLGAGLYPAYLLARLHPTVAMRGPSGHRPGAFLSLRRALVVVQFAISQVLIICTLAAVAQLRYLHQVPLGYEPDAVVEFFIPERDDVAQLERLKQEMRRTAAVEQVTFSNSGATSGSTWSSNFYIEKDGERLENQAHIKLVDGDYLDTYGMELVAGAAFVPSDTVTSVLVNEAFVARMGYAAPQDVLGTTLEVWSWNVPIAGVVQDFNTRSLHRPIEPTVLIPTVQGVAYVGAARVNMARLGEALPAMQAAWEAVYPAYVYEHEFLDETIASFYEEEEMIQRLIQAFALIAILIGCIGLFGLISYTTSQRSKEVGVRKVLGASAAHIVGLFAREFVILVAVGFVISAPVAYTMMRWWLDHFAYRIDLGVPVFAAAFVVSLTIALLTVGYKTYRTATINPVDAIRYE